jgi:hypothetical protein
VTPQDASATPHPDATTLLTPEARSALEQEGGALAEELERVATSPAYGAPQEPAPAAEEPAAAEGPAAAESEAAALAEAPDVVGGAVEAVRVERRLAFLVGFLLLSTVLTAGVAARRRLRAPG